MTAIAPNSAAASRVTGAAALQSLRSVLDASASRRDLLVYVHVPFCSSKCTFCDWVTPIPGAELRADGDVHLRYAKAVEEQIRFWSEQLISPYYQPNIVYWGGGTPTRLAPGALEVLCRALQDHALRTMPEGAEYTVECSPETATRDKLVILRAHGARRLSMGVQSFDEQELKICGRSHGVADIYRALEAARGAGFDNVNFDLIAGLPGQSHETLMRSIAAASDCGIEHLSLYVFRATTGTGMAKQLQSGRKTAERAEHMLRLYVDARNFLAERGFEEYSIGYFSRGPGLRCSADQYYYELEGEYIGFGAGGYSIIANHYLTNHPVPREGFLRDPTGHDVVERFSLNTFSRQFGSLSPTIGTSMGMNFARFERLYGIPFSAISDLPVVAAFMAYYEYCGAEFVRDDGRLFVSPSTRTRAFVNATSGMSMML